MSIAMTENKELERTKLRLTRINELVAATALLKSADHPKVIINAVKRVRYILGRIDADKRAELPKPQPKGLDHGVLSIPNRTKNINRDLDKYLAEKAKADKRAYEDRVFLAKEALKAKKLAEIPVKEQAQAAYKKYGTPMVKKYKLKLESQGINARDFFRGEAKYKPENFLKLVNAFIRDNGE